MFMNVFFFVLLQLAQLQRYLSDQRIRESGEVDEQAVQKKREVPAQTQPEVEIAAESELKFSSEIESTRSEYGSKASRDMNEVASVDSETDATMTSNATTRDMESSQSKCEYDIEEPQTIVKVEDKKSIAQQAIESQCKRYTETELKATQNSTENRQSEFASWKPSAMTGIECAYGEAALKSSSKLQSPQNKASEFAMLYSFSEYDCLGLNAIAEIVDTQRQIAQKPTKCAIGIESQPNLPVEKVLKATETAISGSKENYRAYMSEEYLEIIGAIDSQPKAVQSCAGNIIDRTLKSTGKLANQHREATDKKLNAAENGIESSRSEYNPLDCREMRAAESNQCEEAENELDDTNECSKIQNQKSGFIARELKFLNSLTKSGLGKYGVEGTQNSMIEKQTKYVNEVDVGVTKELRASGSIVDTSQSDYDSWRQSSEVNGTESCHSEDNEKELKDTSEVSKAFSQQNATLDIEMQAAEKAIESSPSEYDSLEYSEINEAEIENKLKDETAKHSKVSNSLMESSLSEYGSWEFSEINEDDSYDSAVKLKSSYDEKIEKKSMLKIDSGMQNDVSQNESLEANEIEEIEKELKDISKTKSQEDFEMLESSMLKEYTTSKLYQDEVLAVSHQSQPPNPKSFQSAFANKATMNTKTEAQSIEFKTESVDIENSTELWLRGMQQQSKAITDRPTSGDFDELYNLSDVGSNQSDDEFVELSWSIVSPAESKHDKTEPELGESKKNIKLNDVHIEQRQVGNPTKVSACEESIKDLFEEAKAIDQTENIVHFEMQGKKKRVLMAVKTGDNKLLEKQGKILVNNEDNLEKNATAFACKQNEKVLHMDTVDNAGRHADLLEQIAAKEIKEADAAKLEEIKLGKEAAESDVTQQIIATETIEIVSELTENNNENSFQRQVNKEVELNSAESKIKIEENADIQEKLVINLVSNEISTEYLNKEDEHFLKANELTDKTEAFKLEEQRDLEVRKALENMPPSVANTQVDISEAKAEILIEKNELENESHQIENVKNKVAQFDAETPSGARPKEKVQIRISTLKFERPHERDAIMPELSGICRLEIQQLECTPILAPINEVDGQLREEYVQGLRVAQQIERVPSLEQFDDELYSKLSDGIEKELQSLSEAEFRLQSDEQLLLRSEQQQQCNDRQNWQERERGASRASVAVCENVELRLKEVEKVERSMSEIRSRLPVCANVRSCSCCPYGYHIDLDFVRYCEALANAKPSEEELRRRSKRRSRKSMEVMLGMESIFDQFDAVARVQALPEAPHESETDSPYTALNCTPHSQRPRSSSVPRYTYGSQTRAESPFGTASSSCSSRRGAESDVPYPPARRPANSPPETRAFLHDALDDVCSDFERTLERASGRRKKLSYASWTNGLGNDRNNNKMLADHTQRNGYALPSSGNDFDSCVAGNKSPRNSHIYGTLPSFQRKPSIAEQQYESYVQSKVVENAKSPVEQLEGEDDQGDLAKEQIHHISSTLSTPPPPPPRRHTQPQSVTSPTSTSTTDCAQSPLSEKSSGADASACTLLSPASVTDGTAATDAQTLYNIRQQMALSLRRMKDLEEQVKSIPEMQHELNALRSEKQRLQQTLHRKEEELQLRSRPSASPSPVASLKNGSFTPQRISPVSLESLGSRLHASSSGSERPAKQQQPLAVLKREVGTMCGRHATRDIAVGSPVIMLRTVGTNPLQTLHIDELLYTRLELDERIHVAISSYEEQRQLQQLKKLISVGTQMYVPQREVREMGAQTAPEKMVLKYAVGVLAKPSTRESFVNCRPDVRSLGCSEDRITDELCERCAVHKRTVACGTDEPLTDEKAASQKLLEMPARSNTFSLGDHEKLPISRKTIGTQYTPLLVHNVSSQTVAVVLHAVGVQHAPQLQHACTQSQLDCSSRQTDTRDLIRLVTTQTSTEEIATPTEPEPESQPVPLPPPKPQTCTAGCNTEPRQLVAIGVNTLPPVELRHSASNTEQVHKRDIACGGEVAKPHISIACADNYCDSCKDAIKHLAKDFSKVSKPPSPLPTRALDSRIPRPKHITSPSPVRKQFQRQNTYTITPTPTPTSSPVSEKKDIVGSLQEKPPTAASFHQLDSSCETQSFITEPTSQQSSASASSARPSRLPQASQRVAATAPSKAEQQIQEAEQQEPVLPKDSAQSPQAAEAYELTHALQGELIVKEEKRVSISWSRDASPAPVKSLESSFNEKLKECTEPTESSASVSASTSPDAPRGGARRKTPTLLKSSQAVEDVEKQQSMEQPMAQQQEEQQQQQQKPPSKALLQKLAMVESEPRMKVKPGEKMLGALKTINSSLLKKMGAKSFSSLSLTTAKNAIQEEWFRISSTEQANPHQVEDYLDCFEEFSVPLLEYCVNMGDSNGNTAMHYAVSHGNFDVVSILLDSKVCNVNQLNNAGYTCVMLVSLAKLKNAAHRTVVQRLFQMADVNIRAKKHCQTALMLAVSHGNRDMVEMLLEAGADINIQDEDGSTALMGAAEHGRVEIVKDLLSQPDCNSLIRDVDGSTAFKIAWQAGHRDVGVLLYVHEQMLRSKLPNRGESPHTPAQSPHQMKQEPPK